MKNMKIVLSIKQKFKNGKLIVKKQLKIGQFETITTMYTKMNKPKKSTRTERIELTLIMAQVFEKIVSLKKEYTVHKYQIYNNKFYWPTIIPTTTSLGDIYHMDFSENVSQHFKYEPQSSHFNKK